KQFHVKREEQERLLFSRDQLAGALLKSPKASADIKFSQILTHGEETMSFLRNCGIAGTQLHYAASFVRNVQDLVMQCVPKGDDDLSAFLSDVAAVEHGVSTTLIASLLVSSFNF